jgi:hypothetical protein
MVSAQFSHHDEGCRRALIIRRSWVRVPAAPPVLTWAYVGVRLRLAVVAWAGAGQGMAGFLRVADRSFALLGVLARG